MRIRGRRKHNRLNRFTSLPVLLDMLSRKCLTLLDARSWEDRNDSFYIEQYKAKEKLRSVLVMCFTTKPERFHHWRIFAHGPSGVCVEFNKELLLAALSKTPGIRSRRVNYRLIRQLKTKTPPVQNWPFLKRRPFIDESE